MTRVALIACGAAKRVERSMARDLYTGGLFRGQLAHALTVADRVFILSALHGLVFLDEELDPYNLRLTRAEGHAWGRRVVERLKHALDNRPPTALLVLAGADYIAPLRAVLPEAWPAIEDPLKGLFQGQRLHWLKTRRGDTARAETSQQMNGLI